ncbi:MAG: hypothetical protein K8H86_04890, partial [Ignavibacteriaceae bacterium]|nr:hypothetical protein [Ignavibacteriaceae bacterium]
VSQDTKLAEISQRSLTDVGDVIDHDFNRLGYRVETGSKIKTISATNISFTSDIDNNGVIDTITYLKSINTKTGNLMFRRVGTGQTSSQWSYPISDLLVEGLDSAGTVTYTINNIKSIAVTVMLVGKAGTDFNVQYGQMWKRQFFPKNL